MPIQGLSEKRRPIRGGFLRTGERRVSERTGKEYPAKLDHFLFDPIDEQLLPLFTQRYGEKPKSLPILLPSNELEDVFPHYYQYWQGGKLLCEGDNITAKRRNLQAGTSEQIPCNEDCPFRQQKDCKPTGTLRVLLYQLPTFHLFEVRTSSINSILQINTCLDMIQSTFGRLAGVELVLSLVERSVVVEGKKQTIYTLQLDARTSIHEIMQAQAAPAPNEVDPSPPALTEAAAETAEPLEPVEEEPIQIPNISQPNGAQEPLSTSSSNMDPWQKKVHEVVDRLFQRFADTHIGDIDDFIARVQKLFATQELGGLTGEQAKAAYLMLASQGKKWAEVEQVQKSHPLDRAQDLANRDQE